MENNNQPNVTALLVQVAALDMTMRIMIEHIAKLPQMETLAPELRNAADRLLEDRPELSPQIAEWLRFFAEGVDKARR